MPETDASTPAVRDWAILLSAVFLTVLGTKLVWIAAYGNATPYWDQWDAEAAFLYKPYLEGTLDWAQMVAPHNEHRIFFTRVLGLGLLEAAGGWDPVLQMMVNAGLHAAFLALLALIGGLLLPRNERLWLAVVIVLLFAIPLGWENTLAGFQSQFYLLLLFSVGALWLLIDREPLSPGWLAGAALSICAYFSLASGAFAAVAAVAVAVIQMAVRVRPLSFRQMAGLALLVALAGIMLANTVTVGHHEPLKAHSIGQWLGALLLVASLPLPGAGLILHLPMIWLAVTVLAAPSRATRSQWLVLAVGGWVLMQMVSLAYGRAIGAGSSRYQDLIIILLPLDYAALLSLVRRPGPAGGRIAWLPVAWVGAALVGLAIAAPHNALEQTVEKGRISLIQEQNVKAFLASGDPATINDKPFLHIPYPSAERLAMLLSDPTIRSVLPDNIRPDDADVAQMRSHLVGHGATARHVAAARAVILRNRWLILALGVAGLYLSQFLARRSRHTRKTDGQEGGA